MNITVSEPYSNNYFIIIGDWGATTEYTELREQQTKVADKLQQLVKNQTENGKNLLFFHFLYLLVTISIWQVKNVMIGIPNGMICMVI